MEELQLTTAGRPILDENEVEICTIANITISKPAPYDAGSPYLLRLSSFRLMWQSINGTRHYQVKLENIEEYIAPKSSFLWSQTRVSIKIRQNPPVEIEMHIRESRDFFLNHFKEQLAKQSWLKTRNVQTAMSTVRHSEFDPSKAGITGILKTVQTKSQQTEESLQAAFQDLGALMKHAEAMVQLANKLSARLGTSAEKEGDAAFHQSVMHQMGIWSPVTRHSTQGAVDLYYQELARELYQFLEARVLKVGSSALDTANPLGLNIGQDIILLTDLYCIFNRARGTELISPDDLLRACQQFEQLKLPVCLRNLNGFYVVTTTRYDDEVMARAVADSVARNGPVTAMYLATTLRISLPLAKYYLEKAEEKELLCRDESHEGLIFYTNIFMNI